MFKVLTFQDFSLIESFTLNLLLKTNHFYFLNCLRDSFPANHYFCPKPVKHDFTLSSFMTDVSSLVIFLLSECVKLMA